MNCVGRQAIWLRLQAIGHQVLFKERILQKAPIKCYSLREQLARIRYVSRQHPTIIYKVATQTGPTSRNGQLPKQAQLHIISKYQTPVVVDTHGVHGRR